MSDTYNEMRKQLRARWRPTWSNNSEFQQVDRCFKTALTALDSLITKRSALEASKKFSNQGLMEEARNIAQRETVPALKQVSDALECVRSQIASRKNSASGPRPDPADTVGAVLRGEMRAWLRSLPHAQAMQLLLEDKADERLVTAALEVPAAMAGLTDQMQEIVRSHVVEKLHGPELANIEELSEAVILTGSALEIALYQMRREIGFSETASTQFDIWMKAATASHERDAEKQIDTGSELLASMMTDARRDIDEIFAKAFPAMYPNHPVNKAA